MQMIFRRHMLCRGIREYHEFKMNNNTPTTPRHEIQNDAS